MVLDGISHLDHVLPRPHDSRLRCRVRPWRFQGRTGDVGSALGEFQVAG